MPVELKDLINSLGITDFDPEKNTIEDFNNSFNSHFIKQTDVLKDETIKSKIVGNVLGKLSTHAAQTFGFTKQDVDGVKFEEILGKVKTKYETQIAELAEKAGVGLRFIRDLEQGKESLRIDKVNQVLKLFGFQAGAVKLIRDVNEES